MAIKPVIVKVNGASLVSQMVKNLPAMPETCVQSFGQEDPLQVGMATHSSILAWKIPWTEQPDGLQSMGSQRVANNRMTKYITAHSKGEYLILKTSRILYYSFIFIWKKLIYYKSNIAKIQIKILMKEKVLNSITDSHFIFYSSLPIHLICHPMVKNLTFAKRD